MLGKRTSSSLSQLESLSTMKRPKMEEGEEAMVDVDQVDWSDAFGRVELQNRETICETEEGFHG